jgi:hypothetical protein
VSLINHDGSLDTARWIGVHNPVDRAALTQPLVLNEPFGSDIVNGVLYPPVRQRVRSSSRDLRPRRAIAAA